MFIERSAARIRFARTAFLVAGLVPCVALAAWAVHLRSAGHREAVRSRWQQAVGLPLTLDAVEHPRPGVTRVRGCTVLGADGAPLVTLPVVELETAVDEDRLTVDAARIDARAAAAFGDLAREWLRRDARHPKNCIVEVADFAWSAGGGPAEGAASGSVPAGLRVECVAQGGTRAVRIVRRGGADDEVRVVREVVGEAGSARETIAIEARCAEGVPAAALAAASGWAAGPLAAGPATFVRGEAAARWDDGGWSGSCSGRIEGVDLAAAARGVNARAAGTARIHCDRLAWRDGRLTDAELELDLGGGWIDAALFDRLVLALGCRPGPAAVAGEATRVFDHAGCVLRLAAGGVSVLPAVDASGGLASLGRIAVLQPPTAPVPFERIAWLASPPASTFVPASGAGAWLMSVVPAAGGPGGGEAEGGRDRVANPPGRGGRREF